ncbi:MAG TPA: Hsp20/alpha crystallin family protein [Solirubrobacterales bacterium]|jgi:HSP20 family protein|nr:Hsp20/alpha crystallin family protein [Solirubrobacterales bacterium]
MTSKRDPFADFARMRRDMDALLGDFWNESGYRARRPQTAFIPRLDLYYCGEDAPERAVIKMELPGVDVDAVSIEVQGRTLIVSGERPVRETEGRTYQQVELPSGPFRRVVELSVDVAADEAQATYEDGLLRIELPVRTQRGARQVPIERAGE